MTQVVIEFNNARGEYKRALIEILFPLIANVANDCAPDVIQIPFDRSDFDELFVECMSYIHEPDKLWVPRNKRLYEFLLCDVRMDIDNYYLEQSYVCRGLFDLLKLRFEIGFHVKRDLLCTYAAERGDLEMLEWLHSRDCTFDVVTAEYAASGGHIDVLEWLHANDCPFDSGVCYGAAKSGHLDVLQWLCDYDCDYFDESVCCAAALGGHLDVLQWLRAREPKCPWNAGTYIGAIDGNHIEIIEWIRANRCPGADIACDFACRIGQFEILKWLRANNYSWDKAECEKVAKTREIRAWIYEQPD